MAAEEQTTDIDAQAPDSAPDTAADNTQAGTILGGAQGTAPENTAGQDAAPQVPEAYDFKDIIPEGMEYSEEHAAAFSAIAKDCKLTQEQAAKVAAYGMQYAREGVAMAEQAQQARIAGWGEAAKKELGAEFDHTTAMAARGIRALETKVPGIKEMLNETGAGNRIEMIKILAELGQLTGDDAGHTGGAAGAGGSNVYGKTNFNKYI